MMGDWNKTKLEEILTESKIPVEKENEDIYKRLSVKLHLNGVHKREVRDNDNIGKTRYYERKAGQFIYGKQNLHNGAVGIIPKRLDGYQSSSDIPTFDISKKVNSKWLLYYFSRKHFYKGLERLSTGTGSKRVNPKNLLELSIDVPSLKEQQRIAAILSSVDEAIERTEQIIAQTETVKKGLMQELLTKGIGHTEFKDSSLGRIPMEWELKRLEDVSLINMGQSPSSKDCYDYEKGLPFYQGNADFGDLHPLPTKWCDAPRKIADKDDILISVRAPVGEINIADSECCIGRGLSAIKPIDISHRFLYYVLEYYKKSLAKRSQGSTFTAINKGDLTSLIVPIPKEEERIKIVNFLETTDSKNTNEKNNLYKLNKLKQGLMQQLLTGKTRVKVDDSEEVTS